MNLLHNTAAACTSLFPRRWGEMEGRRRENMQSSGPGDEGPFEGRNEFTFPVPLASPLLSLGKVGLVGNVCPALGL